MYIPHVVNCMIWVSPSIITIPWEVTYQTPFGQDDEINFLYIAEHLIYAVSIMIPVEQGDRFVYQVVKSNDQILHNMNMADEMSPYFCFAFFFFCLFLIYVKKS